MTRADVVFFPSCIGSIFSPEEGGAGASVAFLRLCTRGGLTAVVPAGIDGLCCGTVWESKGLIHGARVMAEKVLGALWHLTDEGRIPVVSDASSCTLGLADMGGRLSGDAAERWEQIEKCDAVSYVREHVLPKIGPIARERKLASLALHPTCSSVHLEMVDELKAVAAETARSVTVPAGWGCCGTAGDRGMLHPELTAGACELQAAEVVALEAEHGPFAGYASCNRTCEMGMTGATGRPYRHVLELLEEVTR